jgi:hypothetical protein
MTSYRIHRLREHLRNHFRFAPHVSGAASAKPRDYEPGEAIVAETPYAAFFALREAAAPLCVGDLLETEDGRLRIFKFVGFEEAQWALPEPKAESTAGPVAETEVAAAART